MIKTVRTFYCDACGCELIDYSSGMNVIEFDDEGYPRSRGYDFCEACTKSFVKWMESRRKVEQ